MRHHSPLSPFHLTPQEVKPFLQLAQAHRSPQAVARRARMVLTAHAHPTGSSKQIAKLLSVNDRLVRKWRRRWQESHSLQDAPRSGAPRRFSSQARAQVTAGDSISLQPASLSWRSPGSLESRRTRTPADCYSLLTCHLGQHHWALAHRRADASLAGPLLATHPGSRALSATRPPCAPGV
jgi:transposase-like protein